MLTEGKTTKSNIKTQTGNKKPIGPPPARKKKQQILSTDYWETPPELFNTLNMRHRFLIDAAAKKTTAKCEHFFSEEDDALSIDWTKELKAVEMVVGYTGSIWLNPPYSRGNINTFMEKVADEHAKGVSTIVTLTRFDPSAKWFQQYVDGVAFKVLMLDRRVKFVGAESAYNFPCCVSIYPKGVSDYIYDTDYQIWGW